MGNFQHLAQFLAVFCCSFFSGAAVYINVVEHPARMECGTVTAVAEFAPSYKRATIMQASLAALSFIAAVLAWWAGSGGWWLLGGILQGSVIPFTLLFIMPTNKELLDPSLDKGSARADQLLLQWGRLHAVRSALGTTALLIFLSCLVAAQKT
jgi:hypothetical protein